MIIKEQETVVSIRSLDIGISLLRKNLGYVLLLPILPTIFDILIHIIQHNYPLSVQYLLLTSLGHVFSQSVLLLMIVYASYGVLKGERAQLLTSIKKSIFYAPKVFISYLTLLGLGAVAAIFFFPFLLFIVLLIWAPIFSSFEQYIIEDEEDVERDFFEKAEDFIEKEQKRSTHLFKYQSFVDLGFGRSLVFSRMNLDLTFRLAILLWAVQIIPLGLIALFLGGSLNFPVLLIHSSITPFLQTMIVFAAVIAFLLRLPPKALSEIELKGFVVEEPKESLLERKPQAFIFLILISMASLWFVQKNIRESITMPSSVEVQLVKVDVEDDEFFLSLSVYDSEKNLRWFNEDRLWLEFEDNWAVEDKEKSDYQFNLVAFNVFDKDQGVLNSKTFTPAYKTLEFELKYKANKKLPERARFVLKYKNGNGEYRTFFKSSYGIVD